MAPERAKRSVATAYWMGKIAQQVLSPDLQRGRGQLEMCPGTRSEPVMRPLDRPGVENVDSVPDATDRANPPAAAKGAPKWAGVVPGQRGGRQLVDHTHAPAAPAQLRPPAPAGRDLYSQKSFGSNRRTQLCLATCLRQAAPDSQKKFCNRFFCATLFSKQKKAPLIEK